MKRRSFAKILGSGLLAGGSMTSLRGAETESDICRRRYGITKKRQLLQPERIKEGAVIGLIAPSSPISEEKYLKALQNLNSLGFLVKPGAHVLERTGYLAGTEAQRLEDLHAAFADPAIDAVWCVRGGYGSARMLDAIDYQLIRKHPKPFIGYSDVTALHIALHQRAGLVTYHGPVGASDFTESTRHHFKRMVQHPTPGYTISTPRFEEMVFGEEYRPFLITDGIGRGKLIGGNLSLLSALVGTKYAPEYSGKLVFIEEVSEKPYRIDRMLTQMLQGSDLKEAAGIALGVFLDCAAKPDDVSWTLKEMLMDRLGGLGIPVVYGLPFGHISDQATIPYGLQGVMDARAGTLSIVEPGVL